MAQADIEEEISHLESRLRALKATRDQPKSDGLTESLHVAPPIGSSEGEFPPVAFPHRLNLSDSNAKFE
jgi:hypothetical protein